MCTSPCYDLPKQDTSQDRIGTESRLVSAKAAMPTKHRTGRCNMLHLEISQHVAVALGAACTPVGQCAN